ncbi:DoxX family protein [Candidatus Woesearchaeota archaeon]|nr:DoxX family protein [Candidatus Woesearchaeota archaeon]
MDNLAKNYKDIFYLIFRLLIGALFFAHGTMKFANGTPATLMIIAGVIELLVGAMLFLGVWTRWASFFGAGQMLVAYFMVHTGMGPWWNPIANQGELALLFFAAFCCSFIIGNGRWNVQSLFSK